MMAVRALTFGVLFSSVHAGLIPLRPPCAPLNVVSPYQSVWSCSDNLYGSWPTFWNGDTNGMFGMINVDGTVYRWMGPESAGVVEATVTQTSLVVGATTTTYEFEVGNTGVLFTVKFTTPSMDLDNDASSFHDRPVTYVSLAITSPTPVSVRVYFDTSAESVVSNVNHQVAWSRGNATTTTSPSSQDEEKAGGGNNNSEANAVVVVDMQVGTVAQAFGSSTSDRIDWGHAHLAVLGGATSSTGKVNNKNPDSSTSSGSSGSISDSGSVSSAMASHDVCRGAFVSGGSLSEVEDDTTGPRACNDDWVVLAAELDLSVNQGYATSSGTLMLALDQGHASMNFFGLDLAPLWSANPSEANAGAMLAAAGAEAQAVVEECLAFDASLAAKHESVGGPAYATLTSLVWRQTTGAVERCWNPITNEAWVFMKEISSDGDVSTIDVVYPASPFFLATASPETLRRMLLPLLAYANNETAAYGMPKDYNYDWAPHHLGVWPVCDLAANKQEQMPMEESGNLLLMIAGVAKLQGSTSQSVAYLEPYWQLLNRYADYLVSTLPDPGDQLCTDDFEGASPHNVNLAAKGIVALAAWAEVLLLRDGGGGSNAGSNNTYAADAMLFAQNWTSMGVDDEASPNHYKLQYNLDGSSWSQKYNLLFQYVLDLPNKPFDDSVIALEEAFYLGTTSDDGAGKMNTYGVPLDDRADFTKLDWSMWCAAMGTDAQFQAFTDATFKFANECTNRVPLSDWTKTSSPTCQRGNTGFRARPVMGGIYAKLLMPS